jgi:hypothetical protein
MQAAARSGALSTRIFCLAGQHRHGLVKRARQRRRFKVEGTPLSSAPAPNDLWCADFKGELKFGNGQYCYALTLVAVGLLLAITAGIV